MAAIWNEIVLEWEGEEYTVRPSINFLNHLEQEGGTSLSAMLVRLGKGDLPTGRACQLIARTLTYAGCKGVTPETVFSETGGIGANIIMAAQTILLGCMPAPQDDGAAKKKVTRKTAKKK
tara:strand:+ start:3676 stop:4035 length:360 start_codon:yes stop_codon:yes gene_type:complete